MAERVFIDGTGITPGSEQCKCGLECEMPCWQRIGIAPACGACGCPAFPEEDCLCGYEGPDEFGNYDLIEHSECPLHGPVTPPRNP